MKALTIDEELIVNLLIQNPLQNINNLKQKCEELNINLSYHKINQIYESLVKNGVLRARHNHYDPELPGNIRELTDVEGRYRPEALGLKRMQVILYGLVNREMERVIEYCNKHPYTHYQIFAISSSLNVYLQFDIPIGSDSEFFNFLEYIKVDLKITHYKLFEAEWSNSNDIDLSRWDQEAGWVFSVFNKNDEDSMINIWKRLQEQVNSDTVIFDNKQEKKNIINQLDKLDLLLLRELTLNAKISPKTLSQNYDKSIPTLSRRINRLEKEVLGKPILQYDRAQFDINNTQLIVGEMADKLQITRLQKLLSEETFPFRYLLSINRNEYILILWTPPNIAAELSLFFWQISKKFEVHQLVFSDGLTWVYPFYHKNYDFNKKTWKINLEYMQVKI
jgi:hypothetical protein